MALRGADQGGVGVVDGRLSHGTPRKAPVKAPPVADFNMFFEFWVGVVELRDEFL